MSAVNRNLIMHALILHSSSKDYAQAKLWDAVRKYNMHRMVLLHATVWPVICLRKKKKKKVRKNQIKILP